MIVEGVVLGLVGPGPRPWLANVVQQGGDAQDGVASARVHALEAVLPDVEGVVAVLGEPHALRELREDHIEDPGALRDPEARRRTRRAEQAHELLLDPLDGDAAAWPA